MWSCHQKNLRCTQAITAKLYNASSGNIALGEAKARAFKRLRTLQHSSFWIQQSSKLQFANCNVSEEDALNMFQI